MRLRTFGIVCLSLFCVATEAVPQAASNLPDDNGFKSSDGTDPICQTVAREYNAKPPVVSRNLCTLIPSSSTTGFNRPAWRTLDARNYLDLIGQATVRREWGWVLSPEYVRSKGHLFATDSSAAEFGFFMKPIWIPAQIIDEVWTPLKPDLIELVDAGKVWIQAANFDLNNDGTVETVYRLSPIPLKLSRGTSRAYEIDRSTLDSIWKFSAERDCVRQEGVLFLSRDARPELREYLFVHTRLLFDVTVRNGTTYLGLHEVLLRPESSKVSPFYAKQLCQFLPRR